MPRGGSPRWDALVQLARDAWGLPRHQSQHPGGMVISTQPLIDLCPVQPASMEGRQMVQWDKDSCGDAGFLKIDLLGLGMLSAVERCVDEIARVRGERIDLSRIPYDDQEVYARIQEAETMGVFQIESPRADADAEAHAAGEPRRPHRAGGARAAGADPGRRGAPLHRAPQGAARRPLLPGALRAPLARAGAARHARGDRLPGPGDRGGDGLRRLQRGGGRGAAAGDEPQALGGGDPRLRGEVRGRRRSSAAPRARRPSGVWSQIVGFSGFGFPKAHSAAFGLLAYQSTWLRVHYRPEFLCALLNEQPMGFYPPDALVHEAQRRGDGGAAAVRGARAAAECRGRGRQRGADGARLRERRAGGGGPRARGRARAGRRRGARSGDLGGALGRLGRDARPARLGGRVRRARGRGRRGRRRQALWLLGVAVPGVPVPEGTQLALPLEPHDGPELRALSRLGADAGRLRLHGRDAARAPARADAAGAAARPAHERATSSADRDGRRVRVAGLVVARQRPATAKGITFMLLEDELGTINLIVPPPVHERFRLAVRAEPLVLAAGRLERREGTANVLVDRIERLERPDLPRAEVKHIEPRRVWSSDAGELERGRAGGAQLRQARLGNIQGMAGRIRVGTSSWADPGFVKEWYPPKMPAKERLPWYAQHFEVVELNSSFYAIPDRNTVRGWVEITPGLHFDVKLHRALSRHSAPVESLPPDLRERRRRPARPVQLTPELEDALAERLVEETAPLARGRQARRLPAPAHARRSRPGSTSSTSSTGWSSSWRPHGLAVELRNRGWVRRRAPRADARLVRRARRGVRRRGRAARTTTCRSCRRSTRSPATTSPTCASTAATPRAT